MTWLFEERTGTLPVVIIGILLVAMLGAGWAKTGRNEALYGLLAALILCGLVLGVQRFVVTDGERALAALKQIAADVERNDLNAVLGHIHSRATRIRSEAASEFPRYRFKEVKITRIGEVRAEPNHLPPQVVIEFNVIVTGSDADGLLGEQGVPRFVVVTFQKEDEHWRVYAYEHHPPQQSIMR